MRAKLGSPPLDAKLRRPSLRYGGLLRSEFGMVYRCSKAMGIALKPSQAGRPGLPMSGFGNVSRRLKHLAVTIGAHWTTTDVHLLIDSARITDVGRKREENKEAWTRLCLPVAQGGPLGE